MSVTQEQVDEPQEFDWKTTSDIEHLRHVRAMNLAERNIVMRKYNWSHHPVQVLGWLSAQKGIGLNSAIACFFNGDPWRFNYLPKRDVGDEYLGQIKLLDAILQRINAGFYLPDTNPCERAMSRLDAWLKYQREDYRDHRRGRWVIEAHALEPLLACKRAEIENELRRETGGDAKVASAKPTLFKKLAGTLAS